MKYLLFALAFLLLPTSADAVWFDSNWDYKVKVEVNPAKVGTTTAITSFPVYLNLADLPAGFHTNVKSDGCDIRILESNETTETAFELVTYATSTDTGELHFMADALSTTSSSTFYIYYGNPSASCYAVTDTYGRNAVWSGYGFVSHDGGITDSSGNITSTNSGTTDATGFIGNGRLYNSTDNILLKSISIAQATNKTISAWVYPTTLGSSHFIMDSQTGRLVTALDDGAVIKIGYFDGTDWRNSGTSATLNTWQKVHWALDSTNSLGYVYKNGFNATGSLAYSPKAIGGTTRLGRNFGAGSNYFRGTLDEFRIKTSLSSSDFVLTEYNNQSSPTTFYWIGPEETEAVAGGVFDGGVIWFD